MTHEEKLMFDALVRDSATDLKSERVQGLLRTLRVVLTEIYANDAHFIYELLQNAEDQGAHNVEFELTEKDLYFRHDGSLFKYDDVKSILDIACSTKIRDETKIGKFGIGFKSVFSYTDEPEIHSGGWHFKIRNLIMPEDLSGGKDFPQTNGFGTVFRFPLGRSGKCLEKAHDEIQQGLENLLPRDILFLNNIRTVRIGSEAVVSRDEAGPIVTVSKRRSKSDTDPLESASYLRFVKKVDIETIEEDVQVVKRDLPIGVAYLLEENAGASEGARGAERYSVVPSEGRNVYIYFPAEKEQSNLRFCIHGAFAPTVNRDCIRMGDTGNRNIFKELALLQHESLVYIRDNGYLNAGFLNVLPNSGDNLTDEYVIFRTEIKTAFKTEPFTPKKYGGFSKSGDLRQTPLNFAVLSDVFNDSDISSLEQQEGLAWVRNVPQRNSKGFLFLQDLAIQDWGIKHLVCAGVDGAPIGRILQSKSPEVIVRLYETIFKCHQEIHDADDAAVFVSKLRKINLIQLSDGSFARADNGRIVYGDVPASVREVKLLNASLVCAKEFLQLVGIKKYDEKSNLEDYILTSGNAVAKGHEIDVDDNKLYFLTALDALREGRELPANISNFPLRTKQGHWVTASRIFLDLPYCQTGLSCLYEVLARHYICQLDEMYYAEMSEIERKTIAENATDFGFITALEIVESDISYNPHWSEIQKATGGRERSDTCTRRDFDIGVKIRDKDRKFPVVELSHSILSGNFIGAAEKVIVAHLVWDLLMKSNEQVLEAVYQPNYSAEVASDASTFVARLKSSAWLPGAGGKVVKPADAEFKDIPESWSRPKSLYDHAALKAIGFGDSTAVMRKQRETDIEVLMRYGHTREDAERMASGGNPESIPLAPPHSESKKSKTTCDGLSKEPPCQRLTARFEASIKELSSSELEGVSQVEIFEAKVIDIPTLLRMNLCIPWYQRPYKWTERNVVELLDDVCEAVRLRKSKYRIGSVILHREKVDDCFRYNIVDGQQRTLTLLLITCALACETNSNGNPLWKASSLLTDGAFYPALAQSRISRRNIRDNLVKIREYLHLHKASEKLCEALMNVLEVVVVCVDDQPEAFQLFDSQNSKGRRLAPHDLLKAYHLREMQTLPEDQQEAAVTCWESRKSADIGKLFGENLYRIYKWSRGEKCGPFSALDIGTFKGFPVREIGIERRPFEYTYIQRACAVGEKYQIGEPFAPGATFFRFVEHYFKLKAEINAWIDNIDSVKKVRENCCQGEGAKHVERLFASVLLAYFDRFGLEESDPQVAIRKLCQWAYMVRLDLDYLGPKTPNKYAVGGDGNYSNRVAIFAKIRNAALHTEICNLDLKPCARKRDDVGRWGGLWDALKELEDENK